MDGIEDQPGENTDCRSEAERRQPGFSGIHVSLRPGSARPTAPLSERDSLEEGDEEGTGRAARDDEQPVLFQTDTRPDSGPEPQPSGMGRLLQLRLSQVRLTAISTITRRNVCGFIFAAAANARIVCPKASVYPRTCGSLVCGLWFCRAVLVHCLHESRMREIFMSGSARGESLRTRLLYRHSLIGSSGKSVG